MSKRAKNFLLMLKQGIKGVFQFKAQFIIIIILAFVATFILSISVSTQRSMEASFNKIVKPEKRFDYQGNVQLQSDADANNDPFMISTELDNSSTTNLTITMDTPDHTDPTGKKVITTPIGQTGSFNYVFYNDGAKKGWYFDDDKKADPIDTFITRGTELFLKSGVSGDWNDDAINKLTAFYFESLFNDLKTISEQKDKGQSLSDMKDKIGQTVYSPLAIFTYQNPYWFNEFVNFDKFDTQNPDLSQMFNWVGTERVANRDIFNNAAQGISSLTGFLSNNIAQYNADAVNASNKITTVEQAVEFLFGTTMGSASSQSWVVDGNKVKAYSTNVTVKSQDPKDANNIYATYFSDTTKNTSPNSAIWNSGLRGIANPFIDGNTKTQNPGEYSYSSITNWDHFDYLSFNPDIDSQLRTPTRQNLYGNMTLFNEYYGTTLDSGMVDTISQGKIPNKNNAFRFETAFRVHNELVADITGFQYKLRREATYFDANNQLKFRAVVLDQREDYNFTILHGRYPTEGEVAISEQFARKNKIKVGSFIKAGDAILLVSAIATDALSYLPSQDLSNVIPNPSVSTFLYATAPTIMKIWGGTATNAGSEDSVTENLSYFLYNNNVNGVAGTVAQRKDAYDAFFSNSKQNVLANEAAVHEFVDGGIVTTATGSNLSFNKFSKSPYRYSFSIQPLVFKAYDAITYTAAAIIALIAVISVVVCVKKTIDLNSKQIGILKALGEQPRGISVNYLSYALILGVIVVPLAWVIGNVLQIPFGNMFLTYFSIEPDVVTWDWISFVIAFGFLGVFAAGISYFSAWWLTKKPVLTILMSSVKWGRLRFIDFLKNRVFNKAPFSTRFSLTLTSSGSRQIILMTVVMFIASLLMSLVLVIPSVVSRVKSTYYASVRYANQYDETPMIGNAPLSKNAISYWNGQDYLDDQYVHAGLSLDDSPAKYGYYKDPEAYTSSNSAATTFPQYIYDANAIDESANNNEPAPDKNGVTDFYRYVLNHEQQILAIVGTVFGNNYFTHLGVSFSVGMVDKMYGVLLHSLLDDTNMADGNTYTDQKKLSEAQSLSGWLTSSIPKIIAAIVNSNAASSNEGNTSSDAGVKAETWKEKVMDVIYKVIPSYVKAYVQKSDSRLDQYGISFNNQIYIPGQETLTTTVQNNGSLISGRNQQMSLTGLDRYQKSIILDKGDDKKVFLPDDIKQELMDRINVPMNGSTPDTSKLNESVTYNGMTLYNGSTHKFTFPVLPNKQAASSYKLNVGDTFNGWNNLVQLIQMQSGSTWFDLPKTAWIYDDTDYAKYLADQKDSFAQQEGTEVPYKNGVQYDNKAPNKNWEFEKTNDHYYLEPSRLDNNKLTYTNEFENYDDQTYDTKKDDNVTLKNRAILFKDFKYDSDGLPTGTYVRPEYQYKNFKLMVPQNWVNPNSLLWSDGKGHTLNGETSQWYKMGVDASQIPQSVKDGYIKLASSNPKLNRGDIDKQWIVINPYDLNYYGKDFSKDQKMALTNLVDGPSYWYRWAFAGTPIMKVGYVSVNDMFKDTGAALNGNTSVDLKSVGLINSYNDKTVVVDSDLANYLLDYPTSRDYQYNYQTFDRSSLKPAGQEYGGTTSQFDRYNFTNTQDKNFINNDWSTDPDAKANDLWQLQYQKYADAIGGAENTYLYAPHNFFNSKLSNIDEPLEYTSQISFSKNVRVGQAAIALGDSMPGGTPSSILDSTLLSTTKHLISQVATLAIAIGAMLMVAIIITAALLTMLTGDIYIEQYKRFMVLLRALGYSKIQIFTYTFAPVSLLSLVAWAGANILAWGLVWIGSNILWSAGFAIPMAVTWWPVVICFIVMFISYAGSLWVSSGKARKANPSAILTATAE